MKIILLIISSSAMNQPESDPPDPLGGASEDAVDANAMQVDDLIATVEREAIQHLAAAADEKKQKKKMAQPRKSDSDKMSSVQLSLDSMRSCSSHMSDVSAFLTSILADVNDPTKMKKPNRRSMQSS